MLSVELLAQVTAFTLLRIEKHTGQTPFQQAVRRTRVDCYCYNNLLRSRSRDTYCENPPSSCNLVLLICTLPSFHIPWSPRLPQNQAQTFLQCIYRDICCKRRGSDFA